MFHTDKKFKFLTNIVISYGMYDKIDEETGTGENNVANIKEDITYFL